MATIAEKLQTLQTIKNNIKTSIENKGVSVGDVSFTEYSTKIDEISGGGGGTLETINITENGVYVPSEGVDGYNQVNVNVVPSTNYSYYDGGIDVEGLRALGWSDESIGMLRDNTPHYSWENSEYVVSDANKALYGVVTKDNVNSYKDNPDMVFLPYFEPNYGINLNSFKYVKAIPSVEKQVTFVDCSDAISLETFPVIDTSKATSITFNGCTSLKNIPLLDTSAVDYSMNLMFSGCSSLHSIPLINTSKIGSINHMFYDCSSLQSIPLLDTSNVMHMQWVFANCISLTTIPQLITKRVSNMPSLFYECRSLQSIPLLDTSNVTNISSSFYNCTSLTTIPQLNTSKVSNASSMFSGCTKLQSLPLLDFGNVTNISSFFGYGNITTLTELGGFKNLKINWTGYGSLNMLPNLTYESVMNVINNLYDFRGNGDTSTTRTIQFNTSSKALLSDEDIAIATNKGWTIS